MCDYRLWYGYTVKYRQCHGYTCMSEVCCNDQMGIYVGGAGRQIRRQIYTGRRQADMQARRQIYRWAGRGQETGR